MNGKKLGKIESRVTKESVKAMKNEILDLLRLLGRHNRVEAMRVGIDLIHFTASCVDNIGARPINGGTRKWFCDDETITFSRKRA